MSQNRPPPRNDVSPAMQATVDHSHDTSRTAAPLESISVKKPNGGIWATIVAGVFILCVVVTLILVFG